jgi:patatin-related protein
MDASAPAGPAKEMRVGLVLYGGVSLAIYIYGVAFEFLRAVRSRGPEPSAYTAVLERTGTDLIVDVISGTSAGGINGVFLAKALSNNLSVRSFERLRSLWLEAADFASLLKPGRAEMAALLDEGFFEEKLLDGLDQMDLEPASGNGEGSHFKALDLFVTATDLNGRVLSGKEMGKDFFEQENRTREYRKVFPLKYRSRGYNPSDREMGYDQNDLSHENNERLMHLCRATSAFPGALRPVKVEKSDEVTGTLLQPGDGDTVFLTDGGVLNNKPFTDALKAISRRAAYGKVDRMLFYVEPDPETFPRRPASKAEEPGFWDVISRTAFGIPSYQSISKDLQYIHERKERIDWFNNIVASTEEFIQNARTPEGKPVREITETAQYRVYLESQSLFKGYQHLKESLLRDRLRDVCLAGALSLANQDTPLHRKIDLAFNQALDDFLSRHGRIRFLEAFDAPYRARKYFRLIEAFEPYCFHTGLKETGRVKASGFLAQLWACLDRANWIEWRTWEARDSRPRGWFQEPLRKLKGEMAGLDEASLRDRLGYLLEAMLQPVNPDFKGLQEEFDALSRQGQELAGQIDKFLNDPDSWSTAKPEIPDTFAVISTQFEFRDMFIFPMEALANLGERDPIEIARISPRDATYISSSPRDKLAGDALFHFGGFLEKSWRKNDIMWGRLDAAELIVRTLCKKAGFSRDVTNKFIDSVLREVLETELPEALKSPGGYEAYLREDYKVGKQSLSDIDPARQVDLGLNALTSLRDMLRYDKRPDRSPPIQFVDKLLLRVFNYILLPLTFILNSLFAGSSFKGRLYGLILGGIGIWGGITVALFIIGRALSISWLNIGWPLAAIAIAAVVLCLALGIISMRIKGRKKP